MREASASLFSATIIFVVQTNFPTRRMPGLGKGGKGLGIGGKRRHRKILRDSVQRLPAPTLRRVSRRGGVKRLSREIYPYTRAALSTYLTNVLRDSVAYADHVHRRTITAVDVAQALRRSGRALYGFGI